MKFTLISAGVMISLAMATDSVWGVIAGVFITYLAIASNKNEEK